MQEALDLVFAKVHRVGMGLATGILCGAAVFLVTMLLIAKGGSVVGPRLTLLGQYLPGYGVSAIGAFVGAGWGFAYGFLGGWLTAALRNLLMFLNWVLVQRRVEHRYLKNMLEFV